MSNEVRFYRYGTRDDLHFLYAWQCREMEILIGLLALVIAMILMANFWRISGQSNSRGVIIRWRLVGDDTGIAHLRLAEVDARQFCHGSESISPIVSIGNMCRKIRQTKSTTAKTLSAYQRARYPALAVLKL